MMNKKWYKLDNAAKIFPALSPKDGTNYFRLEALFYEDIDSTLLEDVLQQALKRFPMFCVKIKRGIFWHYFDYNENKPRIAKENPILFDRVDTDEHNRFMFTLEYLGKRLSLEIFHALTDGSGGMEFFKTIIYYYLIAKGYQVINNGSVLTNDIETLVDESQDSFNYNYHRSSGKSLSEPSAYQLKGTNYPDNWVGIIHLIIDSDEVKKVAHQYSVTVTQYLSSVILYALYQNYIHSKKDLPIRLFIPVNVRKIFNSKTLRNFMLYMRTTINMNQNQSYLFQDIIEIVKNDFEKELTKEKLTDHLVANVKIEKNPFVRLLILPIKKFVMRISYRHYGSRMNTVSFSNVGVINAPEDFNKYVARINFLIGVSKKCPLNVSCSTYNKKLTLTFTSTISERNIQKSIVQKLVSDNLNITLESNDLEV